MHIRYTRILVAIDGSEMSEQVLAHAISLAPTSQTRLMLTHVLPPTDQRCDGILGSVHPLEQRHIDVMRSYWGQVMAAGVLADFRIPCGHPGEEICELAQRWGAELILMGHRTGAGMELDSMSRYVLDHAPCPLLILPQSIQAPTLQCNRFASVG